jgi:RNA polymerase sigma-54 factor
VSVPPEVVIPDAIVEYDDSLEDYTVSLFDGRLPSLRISNRYSLMAKDSKVDSRTREFISNNVRDARWLMEAIEQRNHTLLRVVRAVVSHQRDFFDQGPEALKPLPMTQVADQLGVHVATISRAVNGKWLQSPRGIIALRKMFSSGMETESGEDVTGDAVRAALREFIENEDRTKPFGDDQLTKRLNEKGIKIARRTVAKYRSQLGFPSAKLRKEYS